MPEPAKYLEEALRGFSELSASVRRNHPKFATDYPAMFYTLITPWIVPGPNSPEGKAATEKLKKRHRDLGFDGDKVHADLSRLIDEDAHLRECCENTNALAWVLDELFVRPSVDVLIEGAPERVNDVFKRFANDVYGQGPYTRLCYSHLYNFNSEIAGLDFGRFKVAQIEQSQVVGMLGEPTLAPSQSLLQPVNVGLFFIVQEEVGATANVFDWLLKRHYEAIELVRIFQYQKAGVVHIDYSVPFFKPTWVNNLRRFGLFFFGNPRRFPYQEGRRFYTLTKDELQPLTRRLKAYVSDPIAALIKDESSGFRQASLRAGDYYEASLTYERPVERLIALTIALESLFSPGDGREISFRISQTASQLIGSDSKSKQEVYLQLRTLYDKRSQLMHGSYNVKDVYQGTFVTHDEIDRWSDYIREGVLRFLSLYFLGKRSSNDLQDFRKQLLSAAFDPEISKKLRSETDIDALITLLEQGKAPFENKALIRATPS